MGSESKEVMRSISIPEVDALRAAVLADGALARGVRQVHLQHLVVARACRGK